MNSECEDEASGKPQENGDASNGSDRPRKKARFAWQVKGKYHLKNEGSENKPGFSSHNSATEKKPPETINKPKNILDSEKTFMKPSTSISPNPVPYPRYVSSFESCNSSSSTSSQKSDTNNDIKVSVPKSMVVTGSYHEDQCIARWQARQMAKGFVDNTINRVLDSWLRSSGAERYVAFDVADFINNLPSNDSTIENEGILMAISAHGLHNNSSTGDESSTDSLATLTSKNVFLSPPSSPTYHSNDLFKEDAKKSFVNICDSDQDMSYNIDGERTDDTTMTPLSLFPETSSSPYHCLSDTDLQDNLNFEENNNSPSNDFGNFDFMDAAVSFAIQNRGLTSFGTETEDYLE